MVETKTSELFAVSPSSSIRNKRGTECCIATLRSEIGYKQRDKKRMKQIKKRKKIPSFFNLLRFNSYSKISIDAVLVN